MIGAGKGTRMSECGVGAGLAAGAASVKRCSIKLPGGERFTVRQNELLLLSALSQGINYPHSCRVGTCGRCKTRLLSGRISAQIDFALSPLTNRELKDGYILACQAKVRSDLEIDITLIRHDVVLPRMIAGEICSWARLPGDVIDMRIRLEEPLRFEAGHYATLAIAGSFVRRSFSFYDVPDPDCPANEVGFFVKRLPGGAFSEWLAGKDRRGVPIWVEAPFGQMGLDDSPRDALCVAGGTGIAPILSIAGDRLRRYPTSKTTIVFGVRSAEELFALDRLEDLKGKSGGRLRVVPVVSHEPKPSDWAGSRGLVTEALTEGLVPYREVSAFACGSLPMVDAVESRLISLGVPRNRIHADKFEPSHF